MGMVVRTNQMALNANNSLNKASNTVNGSLQKLASGFKINKAADDASGLSISEKMKAQIKALDTASDNCEDGANMIQTAEGYMSETHDMLNRMVELSEKSANGVLEDTDRDALQNEMDQLCGEIDRIATTANFNGKKLMDGSIGSNGTVQITSDASGNHYSIANTAPTGKSFTATAPAASGSLTELKGSAQTDLIAKVGTAAESAASATKAATGTAPTTVKVAVNAAGDIVTDKLSGTALALSAAVDGTNKATAADVTALTTAGYDASGITADTTVLTSDMANAINSYNNTNYAATQANAKDTYGATNTAGYTLLSVAVAETPAGAATANDGIKLQIGESSTAADKLNVEIGSFHTDTLLGGINGFTNYSGSATGETDANAVAATKSNATATYDKGITVDISDQDKASAAADALRQVTNYVSDQRGQLGAQQNRLEHTVNNLTTASENVTAANSRIRDTNMADEMIKYTQTNVVSQAAQAMLAQANTQPQNVLSLLQ